MSSVTLCVMHGTQYKNYMLKARVELAVAGRSTQIPPLTVAKTNRVDRDGTEIIE